VGAEEAVDVFEGAGGGFLGLCVSGYGGRGVRGKGEDGGWRMERETDGVKEVDDGDKGGVEEGPDDVEFPLQGLDADGCDFNDLMRGRRRRISPA